MNRIARWIALIVFSSRWLVVPFLFGLIAGLAALIFKFAVKLVEFALQVQAADSTETIVGLLGLVDLTLTANLVVIVICSSYENFVAPIDYTEHPDWPPGLVLSDLRVSSRSCSAQSSPSRPSACWSGSPISTGTPTA